MEHVVHSVSMGEKGSPAIIKSRPVSKAAISQSDGIDSLLSSCVILTLITVMKLVFLIIAHIIVFSRLLSYHRAAWLVRMCDRV